MRPLNRGLLWTASCILALGCSATVLAQDAQPTDNRHVDSAQPNAAQSQQVSPDASPAASTAELPDSPGVTVARLQDPAPQQSGSAQPSAPAAAQSSPEQNGAQTGTQEEQQQPPQQQKLQRPVGTAAAAAPGVSGVTAAQPAGVAIAPAKQHRVRTIIVRTGAILAGGAAVGGVIALTRATPSKPPGAH